MNITIWDDDPNAARNWKAKLDEVLGGSRISVQAPEPQQIEEDLHKLHNRRREYLDVQGSDDDYTDSELDTCEVLLVDNDLFELPNLTDYSAETVAARASIYTRCGYIVVLNLSPDLDFDLTLLGHSGSKADLHINDKFVADRGLWRVCPKEGGAFRPWHWPLMLNVTSLYESRVKELVELLQGGEEDRPILDYFGFSEGAALRLSRSAQAFLHPEIGVSEVTFKRFLANNANAVGVRDGERIVERNDVEKIARIGARRISKWLERYVLGPQDVVLDFPHLAEKMPFVIPREEQGNVAFWNSFAKLDGTPVELAQAVGIERFERTNWFDRPVVWAEGMESEENVDRFLREVDLNPGELVFCEDSSSFHCAEMCDRFIAGHNSVSDSRFIRWFSEGPEEVRYGPQSRLAI